MYSDPIAAICREVASNSRDANRESGRGNVPSIISIYEPNISMSISDMSISFEDCGPGITPSRMGDVFLKYGASTKRDTNSQTGGFGLGAKTPFAYSDTFTIVTICDVDNIRMKYIYTAMIDSSGKGKMVLMESCESEENTGTKIIVPIAETDRDRFEKECIKATMFWTARPTFKNFSYVPQQLEKVYEKEEDMEEDWSIVYDKDGYLGTGRHWVALVDGIAYFLDSTKVNVPRNLETNHVILMNFNNGDVTVSANREQLQYDDETIAIINAEVAKVKTFLIKKIAKMIKGSKTYLEACITYHTLSKHIDKYDRSTFDDCEGETLLLKSLYSWMKNEELLTKMAKEWRGRKITKSMNIHGVTVELVRRGSDMKFTYDSYAKLDSAWKTYPVIYKDIAMRDNKRNTTLLNENKAFLMVSGSEHNLKPEYAEAQMDFIMNWGIDFQNYSSIEKCENYVSPSAHKYTKQEEVYVDAYTWGLNGGDGDKRSVIYLRSEKDFVVKEVIYATQESLNEKKGVAYDLKKKCQLVAKFLKRPVIIVNERNGKLYCQNATPLMDAIDLMKKDSTIMNSLLAAANYKNAEDSLTGVDDHVEKYIGIKHPAVDELRRIISQNTDSQVDPNVLGIVATQKNISSEIDEFYDKWKEDNYVINTALKEVVNSWDFRYYKSGNKKYEIQEDRLRQVKDTYQQLEFIKKNTPTTRRAIARAKAGLPNRKNKKSFVYLSK